MCPAARSLRCFSWDPGDLLAPSSQKRLQGRRLATCHHARGLRHGSRVPAACSFWGHRATSVSQHSFVCEGRVFFVCFFLRGGFFWGGVGGGGDHTPVSHATPQFSFLVVSWEFPSPEFLDLAFGKALCWQTTSSWAFSYESTQEERRRTGAGGKRTGTPPSGLTSGEPSLRQCIGFLCFLSYAGFQSQMGLSCTPTS